MVRGTPVVDEQTQEVVGELSGMLINPDTGDIAGFFVRSTIDGSTVFLSGLNILSWGTKVHVRDSDVLSPPDDLIRVMSMLESARPVMGQRIITEKTRTVLGKCSDVQFDTRSLKLEWMFPRKFFFDRRPVASSEIIEVTPQAVVVREPKRPTSVPADDTATPAVEVQLPEVIPTPTPN